MEKYKTELIYSILQSSDHNISKEWLLKKFGLDVDYKIKYREKKIEKILKRING